PAALGRVGLGGGAAGAAAGRLAGIGGGAGRKRKRHRPGQQGGGKLENTFHTGVLRIKVGFGIVKHCTSKSWNEPESRRPNCEDFEKPGPHAPTFGRFSGFFQIFGVWYILMIEWSETARTGRA